ncbi:hypothetical protein [Nocardioides ochotonae]|uniref:hypothetical protein n=1 Tax=Nocardioides ochotonae TaxID=2685869 RepID=UPI00140BAA85|nr:hypothetical protein [Nocardioides ochotonae]
MTDSAAAYLVGQVVASVARGGGARGTGSVYKIRADSGEEYTCEYIDVVTEGFRTLKTGDVVRFAPVDEMGEQRARQILKIADATLDDLYTENSTPLVPDETDLEEL